MKEIELIATATFGLEAVVRREIEQMGLRIIKSEDARITFAGDESAIAKANLWLRSADRVLVKMGEFKALSFESLFEGTKSLPWERWISENGNFSVSGTSVKSKLYSISDCQAIVEKAVVERLKKTYHREWFPKTGADYPIKVAILKDTAVLTIDTSGVGLHKRGYRVRDVEAPIKETLAAAMVQLSFWREGRLLVDPFCGSGTIAIEAAMIGKNMAPGLSRRFAAENWDKIPKEIWKTERKKAFDMIRHDAELQISASDISKGAVQTAKENALEAGVEDCIDFQVLPFSKIASSKVASLQKYGIIICNPPYGERIGSKGQIVQIYNDLKNFFVENPTWSLFLITSDKQFEYKFLPKKADRKRKLYNGRLETTYFQYYGEK